jgi:hypothetical protein
MRRLPFPSYGNSDPLRAPSPLQGDSACVAWIKWRADRDGVTLPAFDSVRVYQSNAPNAPSPEYSAYLYRTTPRSYYRDGATLQVGLVTIPAHAIPFARVDLWHAAHQSGATLAECYAEGMAWRVYAERTEKARATRRANWDSKYAALVESARATSLAHRATLTGVHAVAA